MSDAIALLGCVGVVWLAVLSLRWGWNRPKTIELYDRTVPIKVDINTVGTVNCCELIKIPHMRLANLEWNRFDKDGYEIKATWYGPVPPLQFKRSKP